MHNFVNVVERAVWTAIQSGLAFISVNAIDGSKTTFPHLLALAGIAAAVSLAKNLSLIAMPQAVQGPPGPPGPQGPMGMVTPATPAPKARPAAKKVGGSR